MAASVRRPALPLLGDLSLGQGEMPQDAPSAAACRTVLPDGGIAAGLWLVSSAICLPG